MNKRLPLLFRHVMYNLRGGFLVRPLAIALTLGCAGALLSWGEESVPSLSAWVPRWLFPSRGDPQVAQVILGGIATSIMTVVSIVFAILLMTLTLASMQFSPRIIVSFVKDRVTQWTLGIFLGTFSYCMAALPAARSIPYPFAPIATVMGAMLLALACVGWLLFFIHHISQAISVNHIVDRIATETEAVIDEMMPWPRRQTRLGGSGPIDSSTWDAAVRSDVSGYIRFIDTKRLVALAKIYHVKVRVLRRVGQFVPAGIPLLMVSKGDRLSEDNGGEFRGAFDFGPSRTLQQDVEFGVLQIVDIALKAISPAVNDPSTAVSCVDQLSRILIRFVSREPPESVLYDPPGLVRVLVPWIDFDHLLDSALEQIRMYSKTDVAVSLRMLRALGDIAASTADPAYRRTLVARGKRVVAGCAERLGEEEMRPIQARMSALEELAAGART
ncbi:N-6 Adenine-specific DNA methylase [Candidatus Sulfopaludibacter sp. SbA6]|nr:N-6 Adenine-specific DNA methylase [Candidatus Sulfopaludibacter sp. SbA6]